MKIKWILILYIKFNFLRFSNNQINAETTAGQSKANLSSQLPISSTAALDNEQVQVAVRGGVASGPGAEQDDFIRIKAFDNFPDDVINQFGGDLICI